MTTGLATLRSATAALVERAPVRWMALLIVAVTTIGAGAYSYRAIDTELTSVTLARREAVAQLAAAMLTERFARVVDVAVSLSTRVKFRDLVVQGKWTEAIEILRAVPRDLPHIERLILVDLRGTLQADVPALPGVRGKNFAYREWFKGVSREWRPYISPVYTRTAAPQRNVVAVAVPVRNTAEQVVGILMLQMRIESLVDQFESIVIGQEESITVVDSMGQMAFHSRHQDRGELIDLSKTPVVEKLRRGEQGVEIGFDPEVHEEAIVAYAAIPSYGWGVVVQQPARVSGLAARDRQLLMMVTGYGLLLLLGSAMIFLVARIADIKLGQAKDEQRASDLRLANIVNNAADAIISVDKNQRIVQFNRGAETIFGYRATEILGEPLDRLLPSRVVEVHRRHVAGYAAGDESARHMGVRRELAGRRKDGSEFLAEVSISRLNEHGRTILTAILRDISERKRAEEEIQRLNTDLERKVVERTAALQVANQELEAFSYSVSHDLRAPLRTIDGFSQAMLDDYADKLDDQGRGHLNRVRAATQHMGQLIDDMIKLARVARAEMQRETVDLSALAGEVLTALQKNEPERRVECRIEPGLTAEGDARLLRVVLENLLGNAWKFTGKQAHPCIEFGAQPQASPGTDAADRVGNGRSNGSGTAFFVRDNGAGFDAAYAGKLFGAFQRLHTLSEFPGTGVGLATVQRVVHRHGGQVWAEGTVDKGATFYFTL